MAYCCKGQPPPVLTPRDPNWGNTQYGEFVLLLRKYMKAPTCPAELGVDGLDFFWDTAQKRSVLSLRADDCDSGISTADFKYLVRWMSTFLASPLAASDALKYAWDNEWAGYYDTDLTFDSLNAHAHRNRGYDVQAIIQGALFEPLMMGPAIREYQTTQPRVCRYLRATRKTDTNFFELHLRRRE